MLSSFLATFILAVPSIAAAVSLESCPGYKAINVKQTGSSLTADLVLAGKPCNVFGNDTARLVLEVEYEDSESP